MSTSASQSIVMAVYSQKLYMILSNRVRIFNISSTGIAFEQEKTITPTPSYSLEGTSFQVGKYFWFGSSRGNPQVYRLDLETLAVSVYPTPTNFDRMTVFVFEGFVYLVGGRRSGISNTTLVLRRPVEDFTTTWEQITTTNTNPTPLIGGTAFYFGGEFWCVGGAGAAAGGDDGVSYTTFSVYNPTTNTFRGKSLASSINNKYHLPIFAFNDMVIQLGGSYLPDGKRTFDLTLNSYNVQPFATANPVSYHSASVQAGNLGFFHGGISSNTIHYMRLR